MLFNNLKLILRQLAGNKTFSGINLVGLITGLTVCLFQVVNRRAIITGRGL